MLDPARSGGDLDLGVVVGAESRAVVVRHGRSSRIITGNIAIVVVTGIDRSMLFAGKHSNLDCWVTEYFVVRIVESRMCWG